MNGWANYETWNVTLWLANDEGFYALASKFSKFGRSYADLAAHLTENYASHTPDGVAWLDAAVDQGEADDFLSDI